MKRRSQADRLWHTVRARNGARLVLPKGTDPIAWVLKEAYSQLRERVMDIHTPLLKYMKKTGTTTQWGDTAHYFDAVVDR